MVLQTFNDYQGLLFSIITTWSSLLPEFAGLHAYKYIFIYINTIGHKYFILHISDFTARNN
jgi:hypothetical protein